MRPGHVVLAGPKGCGKTTAGALLAAGLGLPFADTDAWAEDLAAPPGAPRRIVRRIMQEEGEPAFRALERRAVAGLLARQPLSVVATGGHTMLDPGSRQALRAAGVVLWLEAPPEVLWERLLAGGVPAWLEGAPNLKAEFCRRVAILEEAVRPCADAVVPVAGLSPEGVAQAAREALARECAVRLEAANTMGGLLRLTTFGESHGPAIGAVLDGLPAGTPVSAARLQEELDRRRPGRNALASSRQEPDRVRVLSGVYGGRATGAPVAMLIENADARPGDYEALAEVFRPGHADYGFVAKFGRRDPRGGGRVSGRETAARVAGGAAALQALEAMGVAVRAWTAEIAGIAAPEPDPPGSPSREATGASPVRCPCPAASARMERAVQEARDAGDTVGGVVAVRVDGVPPGWGDPVFGKLDARLAGALMSIGGVKGIEVGDGFAAARQRGSGHNDPMAPGPRFLSNHAGGIVGGISTGQPILLRLAVKPTPSIGLPQRTISEAGQALVLDGPPGGAGRHDACLAPRIVPVAEAMTALVLLDACLAQKRAHPG